MKNQTKVLEKLVDSNISLISTVSETVDLFRLKLETEAELEKFRIQKQVKAMEVLHSSGIINKIVDIITDTFKGDLK